MVASTDPETMTSCGSGRRLPRVGVLSAWFDPEDPQVWSGVPRAIVDQLRHLGVYGGHRNVTPLAAPGRAVYRWMQLTGRTDGWTLRPEMRALATASDLVRRWTTPADVDGWVHFVGPNADVVRQRYVTFFEMSPSQTLEGTLAFPGSLGYIRVDRPRMEWVARRQHRLHRKAFACCVASQWAADSLVRDHGIAARRVHVVGYGRNLDIPPPAARDWASPRFLFVGNDWNRKNGDAVMRAFVRLRQQVPSARLDVVSQHPPPASDGVVAHGRLAALFDPEARAQLETLYAEATCFVMPSRFEAFGVVYAEAAAAGLPSIAGSVGGAVTSVGAGGILVDPDDDDAIYRAMLSMCDPERAQALGAAALERSSAFTWAAVTQRVLRSLDLGSSPAVELAAFL